MSLGADPEAIQPPTLDLGLDDAQAAIAAALGEFCRDRLDAEAAVGDGVFPDALWRELAALGVLGVATPEGDGGAREVVAAMETLGREGFPGPLAATFLATQLVAPSERVALASGDLRAAVGRGPLFADVRGADVLLEIDGECVHRRRPTAEDRVVPVMGGGRWRHVEGERVETWADPTRGLALIRIALAAQLFGLAEGLVAAAADHANVRRQFGQSIGEFQAVAHPLADVHVHLEAARLLARSAADRFDRDPSTASSEASAAHASARRSAVEAVHVCHQVFGAVGITIEGPAWSTSSRIMALAACPPTSESTNALLYASIAPSLAERRSE